MKIVRITSVFLYLLLASCKPGSQGELTNTHSSTKTVADQFINAFYSFNSDSLQAVLSNAEESQPNILYYQKWAECGHYTIVNRNTFIEKNDSLILAPVTVKDDLMAALEIDFNVTDTFRITLRKGKISSVETSSNDLAVYYEAKEWVKQNHPELIEKPCEGIWNGGPTPCECIQGMLKGFTAFVDEKAK
jgi:hypothetical protein